MEGSKNLFCPSQFPRAHERIYSKLQIIRAHSLKSSPDSSRVVSRHCPDYCFPVCYCRGRGSIPDDSMWDLWSLTLREELKLRVSENRGLRRTFGPKTTEGSWEWRKLHNEDLHDLYCSLYVLRVTKLRRMRWAGHVVLWGRERCKQGFGVETCGKETTWETQV